MVSVVSNELAMRISSQPELYNPRGDTLLAITCKLTLVRVAAPCIVTVMIAWRKPTLVKVEPDRFAQT